MKKVLFTAILLTLASTVTLAQVGISKGIKGGLNFATVGGDDVGGVNSTTQFCAGFFLEIQLPGGVAIEPEILYSVKGFSGNANIYLSGIGNVDVAVTQTLDYIDIPVLLKINLPTPGVTVGFYAGPSLGILVSANAKAEVAGHGSVEQGDKSQFASTDLGIVMGLGIKIPLAVVALTFDARYDLGLSSLDPNGNAKVYNRVFSVMAGLAF